MLGVFRWLLPALIPSWRFFDRIGPAPHVEYALADAQDSEADGLEWHPVFPRLAYESVGAMLTRLVWSPSRNEALYLVSCAERLLEDPTPTRANRLWARVADRVCLEQPTTSTGRLTSMRIRICILTRAQERGTVVEEVVYVSEARPLAGQGQDRAR